MAQWKANWKEKRQKLREARAVLAKENLFRLLDRNYAQHIGDYPKHLGQEKFWEALHKLDADLEPNCIFVEPYRTGRTDLKDLDASDGSEEMFSKGTPTLVIQLKSQETAINGAKLLNKIFSGSGTKFVAEEIQKDRKIVFQIRSNLEKRHWDKLVVFCNYRFDREFKDASDIAQRNAACQLKVSEYTAGTPYDHWDSLEGIPAFVTLMGLPGILRPKEAECTKLDEMQAEFDYPNPRGTPWVFEGVRVHVELKHDTQSEISFMPYTYGFNPNRQALDDATGGDPLWGVTLDALGGNPFSDKKPTNLRITAGMGLVITALAAKDLSGIVGPAAVVVVGGSLIVGVVVNHRFKILKQINDIRRDSKEYDALMKEFCGPEIPGHSLSVSSEQDLRRPLEMDELEYEMPSEMGGSPSSHAIRRILEAHHPNKPYVERERETDILSGYAR